MFNQIGSSTSGVILPVSGSSKRRDVQQTNTDKEQPAFVLELSGTENAAARISGTLESRALEDIRNQSASTAEALENVVEKLLMRQQGSVSSFTINIEITGTTGTVDTTRADATEAISEDGEWGVNAVSDRIVNFAKALAGNDPSQIQTLRAAIDKGFASAKKTLGGTLPDISTQTYDAVMSKLDDWAAGDDTISE